MIVQIENVSCRRGDSYLLKNINWSVKPAEHWAVVGLNGSGKTTLLNMICGYLWPTTGEVSVLGQKFGSVDLRELRKSIGWVSSVLQERLYGSETPEEIVLSGKFATIGLYDKIDEADKERANQLLEELGCHKFISRQYQTLSQGEKQRVLIARALMNSPQILILDEPCTGLDIFAREQLLTIIRQIGEQAKTAGPTLLYVTHYIEEILPVFNNTLLLRRGEIHSAGPTRTVLGAANLQDFFEKSILIEKQSERTWIKQV